MLKQGSQGKDVVQLQQKLNQVGCACVVDGIFGPETRQAVIQFQKAFALDADGIAGPETLAKLDEAQPGSHDNV